MNHPDRWVNGAPIAERRSGFLFGCVVSRGCGGGLSGIAISGGDRGESGKQAEGQIGLSGGLLSGRLVRGGRRAVLQLENLINGRRVQATGFRGWSRTASHWLVEASRRPLFNGERKGGCD